MVAVELPDLGLQKFNEYLSGRSYISGDQPSKDDVYWLDLSLRKQETWLKRLLLPLPHPQQGGEAEDDADILDLSGKEIEEEKKASAERDAQKAVSGKKKAIGKSSGLLNVKPWDDEIETW
ncbi:hypothetical protein L7F22_035904 [Adiantum nelumboides]|nr:hypothetical protein [Adiantum nelumboides]